MNLRVTGAVTAAKAAGIASRVLGQGGGTALPGLVAERLDAGIVGHLGRQLGRRVFVTGTNGKTTTSRMLAAILEAAGQPALHNREGSNLMRGFASTLCAQAGPMGGIAGAAGMVGLFETDEATMPAATAALKPSVLVFTNLFRDQLDRYGEVDTVAALWREALINAPANATLVLNADDPSVASLAEGWTGGLHYFGIDDLAMAGTLAGASDARWCTVCGGTFAYERRYFAHVGWWRCTGCDRKRAFPQTQASDVHLALDRATFREAGMGELQTPLTGLYNVYNALAAIAAARVLGIDGDAIRAGLAAVQPAFGRQEVVTYSGKTLRLLLCKNPAGANEVLRLLAVLEPGLNLAVLLNDRIADGQDVSWIWDVDFETIRGRVATLFTGGTRAEDMTLRLEYAGWPAPAASTSLAATVVDAIRERPEAEWFVIATYTAMRDFRAELQRRGATKNAWE